MHFTWPVRRTDGRTDGQSDNLASRADPQAKKLVAPVRAGSSITVINFAQAKMAQLEMNSLTAWLPGSLNSPSSSKHNANTNPNPLTHSAQNVINFF